MEKTQPCPPELSGLWDWLKSEPAQGAAGSPGGPQDSRGHSHLRKPHGEELQCAKPISHSLKSHMETSS